MNISQIFDISDIHKRLLSYSPSFEIPDFLNFSSSHKFNNFFSYINVNFIFRSYFFAYNFFFIDNSKNFF